MNSDPGHRPVRTFSFVPVLYATIPRVAVPNWARAFAPEGQCGVPEADETTHRSYRAVLV